MVQKYATASEKIDLLAATKEGEMSDWETALESLIDGLTDIVLQLQSTFKYQVPEVVVGTKFYGSEN